MRLFGLIGFPLGHSFSPQFFARHFAREGIVDADYVLFPLEDLSRLPELWKKHPELQGCNVTIPYKEAILHFLAELDPKARQIGAVNTIKRLPDGRWKGYNTDYTGFRKSLLRFLPEEKWTGKKALVFGTGGSSLAVRAVLNNLGVGFKLVSRKESDECLQYNSVRDEVFGNADLLVQTTPLGMFPDIDTCIPIPFDALSPSQLAIDLIYNPEETQFLRRCRERGLQTQNGMYMLEQQALAAWDIWNQP